MILEKTVRENAEDQRQSTVKEFAVETLSETNVQVNV